MDKKVEARRRTQEVIQRLDKWTLLQLDQLAAKAARAAESLGLTDPRQVVEAFRDAILEGVLRRALEAHGWSLSGVAKAWGISPGTVQFMVRCYPALLADYDQKKQG